MRTSRRRPFFIAILVSLSFSFFFLFSYLFADFSDQAFCAPNEAAWTWDILVVPPDEGWDGDAGVSVRRTLLWHQAEVSESGNGIRGHDLNFVFLPPLTEDTVQGYRLPVAPHTIAVFSFASAQVDKSLLSLMAKTGLPLLLGGGENVFFYEQGRLLPFVFALDLFRDYRTRAFVEYASKNLASKTRLGIIATRFTLNEEREARIGYDLLSEAGFMPMPYWVNASVTDTFEIVAQEIKDYSEGVLVSYVGSMGSKELWRGIMGARSPYRLWYGGTPDKSFLSYKGMIFADQNMHLETKGGFEQLKRSLWSSRTVAVSDKVMAGRANALALWLVKALKSLQGGDEVIDRGAFFSELGRVRGIPFGNQILNIDEKTHRPERRQVRILETRNREFFILDTLDIQGLGYYDY